MQQNITNLMNKIFILALFLGIVLGACKKEKKEEVDTQKPSITIIKPSENATVTGGQTLQLEVKFTDNMNLSQYKLEVHPNFDGHTHGKTNEEMPTPWEWDTIVNINGKEHTAKFSISVPSNVKAGNYHLMAMCTDAAGYEAPIKFINIKVLNPDDTVNPVLTLTKPSITNENLIQFATNENEKAIIFEGTLSDNKRVKGIKIQLIEHRHSKTQHGEDKVIYEYQNFNLNGTSFDLSNITFKIYREDMEDNGEYELKVVGYDLVGNSAEKIAVIRTKLF